MCSYVHGARAGCLHLKPAYKHVKSKGKLKRLRERSRPPLRRKLDARKDEQESGRTGEIVTKHMNKILRKNPKANVALSSKKKRKLMKGRMIAEREANEMAVEVEPPKPLQKEAKRKSKTSSTDQDVEMMDT